MNKKLLELRESLIAEAKGSPMLLSDLAGLEAYVSECYNSRSFIELLQNADDAGAERFCVRKVGEYLIVSNDGRPFNSKDMESLCRSASSGKVRGASIGYRGIGFKSVVSIAKEIHLVSGDFEVTFSKELSKQIVPEAPRVPLIRIPHALDKRVKSDLEDSIHEIQEEGYQTIFIFSGVIANQIDDEYTNFALTTLLFLNNIRNIQIVLEKKINANIVVKGQNKLGKELRISSNDSLNDWMVCSDKNCSFAFQLENGKIVRLPKSDAAIHAFLPTEDSSGLGSIVNGDFSTDPSRRHLILDETTNNVIENLAELYGKLLKQGLEEGNVGLLNALMPYFDMKLIQLMKPTFEKEFSIKLKEKCGTYFSKIKLSPNWLNVADYAKINPQTIDFDCSDVTGLDSTLKYLGSKTDDLDKIITKVSNAELSVIGYAQLAAAGMKSILMNRKISSFEKSRLFISESRLCSLSEIEFSGKTIDESFIELLKDNGVLPNEIGIFLEQQGLLSLRSRQFADDETSPNMPDGNATENESSSVADWFNSVSTTQPVTSGGINIQRWRSAEENALAALNGNGFRLHDVSTQNVGYDLEGTDPNGNEICIEVKSIDFAGQKFRMTNNEFAAAQYKQDKYYLAIVMQTADALEISLIKNPVNSLNMNRQCVQWVWECSEYDYRPMKFKM